MAKARLSSPPPRPPLDELDISQRTHPGSALRQTASIIAVDDEMTSSCPPRSLPPGGVSPYLWLLNGSSLDAFPDACVHDGCTNAIATTTRVSAPRARPSAPPAEMGGWAVNQRISYNCAAVQQLQETL